jgi:PAS domain S-box-containing protein
VGRPVPDSTLERELQELQRSPLERALHEVENTFRQLAEVTGDYVVLVERDMRIRFASRSFGTHSPSQLESLPLRDFLPAGISEAALDCVRRVLESGQPDRFSMQIGAGAVEAQQLEVRVSPVRRDGQTVAAALIATDVSEQLRAERAIATQARMIESMLEGVAVVNEGNVIEITNPAFDALFGYRRGELIGRDMAVLGIPPFETRDESALSRAGSPRSQRLEFEGRRREGSGFSVAGVLSRFEIAGRNHCLVVLQDVSERKQLERAILQAVNREQYRIGNDLHDGLGQELTGIALMLRSVAGRLASEYPPLLPEIEGITKLVSNAVESTRALARGLSPVNLERGGLRDALEGLAVHAAELYGVQLHFTHRLTANTPLGAEVSNHLYRIAQEAVRNAVRHGEARIIRLHLSVVRRKVRLVITDDGSGMPQHALDAPGLGLKIMRYRAGILGGSVRFEHAEPRGTRIVCECPIDSEPTSVATAAVAGTRQKRAAVKNSVPSMGEGLK